VIDQGLAWSAIVQDVSKRGFITVGFVAWLLLIPLAITSTAAMTKRLGAARWKQLHRLSYVVGILAAIHFIWRVKRDLSQPAAYTVVLAALLLARLMSAEKKKVQRD